MAGGARGVLAWASHFDMSDEAEMEKKVDLESVAMALAMSVLPAGRKGIPEGRRRIWVMSAGAEPGMRRVGCGTKDRPRPPLPTP